MLVRPSGAAARRPQNFENRVNTQILVRQNGLAAVFRIADQVLGIQSAASVEPGQIHVHGLVPCDIGADLSGAVAARIAQAIGLGRRRQRPIVGVVVPKTRGHRRASRDQRSKSGKGIRRRGGDVVRIGRAVPAQVGQIRVGMRGDIVRQIEGVQPVDADQQHVFDGVPISEQTVIGVGVRRQCQGHADAEGGAQEFSNHSTSSF